MKKFVAILALAATLFAVNAQAQNKEVAAAKAALEKAQAAAENPKQNTKLATWLKYGETLVKAYAALYLGPKSPEAIGKPLVAAAAAKSYFPTCL